jgi:hypothetical protein
MLPIVSAAVPETARPSARERVLGGQQQHSPTCAKYAGKFAQPLFSVRHVFKHITAGDAIKRPVGKGQGGDIRDDKIGSRALQAIPGPAQHLR